MSNIPLFLWTCYDSNELQIESWIFGSTSVNVICPFGNDIGVPNYSLKYVIGVLKITASIQQEWDSIGIISTKQEMLHRGSIYLCVKKCEKSLAVLFVFNTHRFPQQVSSTDNNTKRARERERDRK